MKRIFFFKENYEEGFECSFWKHCGITEIEQNFRGLSAIFAEDPTQKPVWSCLSDRDYNGPSKMGTRRPNQNYSITMWIKTQHWSIRKKLESKDKGRIFVVFTLQTNRVLAKSSTLPLRNAYLTYLLNARNPKEWRVRTTTLWSVFDASELAATPPSPRTTIPKVPALSMIRYANFFSFSFFHLLMNWDCWGWVVSNFNVLTDEICMWLIHWCCDQ